MQNKSSRGGEAFLGCTSCVVKSPRHYTYICTYMFFPHDAFTVGSLDSQHHLSVQILFCLVLLTWSRSSFVICFNKATVTVSCPKDKDQTYDHTQLAAVFKTTAIYQDGDDTAIRWRVCFQPSWQLHIICH